MAIQQNAATGGTGGASWSEAKLAASLSRIDVDAARATYLEQGEMLQTGPLLPQGLVDALVAEAALLRHRAHRSYLPSYKKSGSVGYQRLREEAPTVLAVYRSPALLRFLDALTGAALMRCTDEDPHACALYYYTEPGDHVGFHYDSSHYSGARYTVLVGLVDRSTSRLRCRLHTRDGLPEVDLALATTPGTMVAFHGDKLWHSVSPLGPGEERIVLALEFVTSHAMSRLSRAVSDFKDAVAYFGVGEVLRGRSTRGSGPG